MKASFGRGLGVGLTVPALLISASVVLIARPAVASCGELRLVHVESTTNGRGARTASTGMLVENSAVDCARASLIGVSNLDGSRQVWIGWYEKEVSGFPWDCPITTGPPRVLVMKYYEGTYYCDQTTTNLSGLPDMRSFSVHDNDQDGTWEYGYGGSQIATYGLGTFVTGFVFAHSERKYADPMEAEFRTLFRMNSSQDWVAWPGAVITADIDAQYRGCILASDWVSVQQPACP